MAKVQLVRAPQGFVPDSQGDADALEYVRIGDAVSADIRKARNPQFHRKAFAMLHDVFDAQDVFEDFGKFYIWMKIKAGAVDTIIGDDGETYYVPKSLAWASMDEIEFSELYQKLLTVAYQSGYEWVLEQYG